MTLSLTYSFKTCKKKNVNNTKHKFLLIPCSVVLFFMFFLFCLGFLNHLTEEEIVVLLLYFFLLLSSHCLQYMSFPDGATFWVGMGSMRVALPG